MTKNLSTTISGVDLGPHSGVNLRKLDTNQLFYLISYEFVLFLRTISASKVTIVQPRAESTVHIEPGGR